MSEAPQSGGDSRIAQGIPPSHKLSSTPPPELPSANLFYHGRIPEPLSQEERQWLVNQLNRYPDRVNEARTCAIGALTDMAVTEFCRLMGELAARSNQEATRTVGDAVEGIARAICEAKGYDPDMPINEHLVQWQTFTELARSTVKK